MGPVAEIGSLPMALLVLSDDDSVRDKIPNEPTDVLVSCGDIADSVILHAAQTVGCAQVLAVKDNHDSGGRFQPPIIDLHLTTHTIGGVRFGGFHGSWRYKPRGVHQGKASAFICPTIFR